MVFPQFSRPLLQSLLCPGCYARQSESNAPHGFPGHLSRELYTYYCITWENYSTAFCQLMFFPFFPFFFPCLKCFGIQVGAAGCDLHMNGSVMLSLYLRFFLTFLRTGPLKKKRKRKKKKKNYFLLDKKTIIFRRTTCSFRFRISVSKLSPTPPRIVTTAAAAAAAAALRPPIDLRRGPTIRYLHTVSI